jgi:hypothetical protein
VERKDLQKILKEQELQLSGLVEDPQAVKVGAMPQSTTVAVYADAFHAIIVPGSS